MFHVFSLQLGFILAIFRAGARRRHPCLSSLCQPRLAYVDGNRYEDLHQDYKTLERKHILSAYFTFVGLDDHLKPVQIRPVIPETEDEKRRYAQAEQRRVLRIKSFP